MADLRTRFRALDAATMPDLWTEIERRATTETPTVERLVVQRTTFLGAPLVGSSATRRLVLLLVLIGLLVLAILGATLVGRWRLDPLRADVPTGAPSDSRRVFTSDLYGYSIALPEGWDARAATRPWSGYGWGQPAELDELAGPAGQQRVRFTVVGRHPSSVPPDGLERWMNDDLSLPPELMLEGGHRACDFDGVLLPDRASWGSAPEPTLEFRTSVVAGYPTRLRSVCGHVDGVMLAEGGSYLLSLVTPGRIDGDEELFDAIAGTLRFEPRSSGSPEPPTTPGPSPTATVALPTRVPLADGIFESETYGYRVRLPAGWDIRPASGPWTDPAPWDRPTADEAAPVDPSSASRFDIAARDVSVGWSEQAWLDAFVPRPVEYEAWAGHGSPVHGHCFFRRGSGTNIVDSTLAEWEATTIAGRPGYERGTCGHVEGVIFDGGTAFVLSLYTDVLGAAMRTSTAPRVDGDREAFHAIADTFEVTRPTGDRHAAAPTERWDSVLYGYSIRYPQGWTPSRAATGWIGDGDRAPGMADTLLGPDGGRAQLTIAARPRLASETPLQWIGKHVPLPKGYSESGGEGHCATPGHAAIAADVPSAWSEATIGPYSGWIRWLCGQIDGVTFANGMGYHLTYAVDDVVLPYGETDVFDAFADTFRLDP